jgi:hypothetical protein
MATARTTEQAGSPGRGSEHPIVVVDIEHIQSVERVNLLRKGQGKLMKRVEGIIKDLVNAGTVKATAQPVVIVVRESPVASFFGFDEQEED